MSEKLEDARKRFQKHAQERIERRARLVAATPPPRYDDVFFEGVMWLDSLAGEPIEDGMVVQILEKEKDV